MPPHKSKSNSIAFVEGQQNGAGDSSPLRLSLRGRLRRFVGCRSAFYLSRQRHGAGMNQMRLHRHATAAMCGSCAPTKNPCRTKTPAPAFLLPHTTLNQNQARSLRAVFYCSRPPSLSGCAGSRCAAPFPLNLPRFPSAPWWLPENE